MARGTKLEYTHYNPPRPAWNKMDRRAFDAFECILRGKYSRTDLNSLMKLQRYRRKIDIEFPVKYYSINDDFDYVGIAITNDLYEAREGEREWLGA